MTTSDGDVMTSVVIERNGVKHQRLRRGLPRKGTRAAKRHLKQLAGNHRRFQTDVNHATPKQLVQCAVHATRAIAVEALTGIRTRSGAWAQLTKST
ncbi:MAG: hypothetical protein SGI73_14040 [Chloroflexota bacterium]|nr:hypothetical protein [Chloroflexota bacterium]